MLKLFPHLCPEAAMDATLFTVSPTERGWLLLDGERIAEDDGQLADVDLRT